MKRHHITDALQITAAIVLTGGMLVSAAPLPEKSILEPVAVVESASATQTRIEPEKPSEQPETKPEAPKIVEDPNNCEPERYWAKEPPHECLDKPTQAKSVSNVATSSPAVSVGGSCEDWMAQAGIPVTNATRTLIINESGCRPDAVNPSSGACGIPQALPCSKLPCSLQDPVCQLKWMDGYVKARYTTWERALGFWHCIGQCSSNYGTVNKVATWY